MTQFIRIFLALTLVGCSAASPAEPKALTEKPISQPVETTVIQNPEPLIETVTITDTQADTIQNQPSVIKNEIETQPILQRESPQPFNEPITMNKPEPQCTVFDDFSGNQTIYWQRVNDSVMGGRSIGDFSYENGTMVLSGSINLNGGGFTSVRAPLAGGVLEPYNALKITAKSDGRGYALTFRDSNRQRLSHRLKLNLNASADWQETTIRFEDLQPAFFGEPVRAAGFNKAEAREIGIILNDGAGGDYNLVIDKIELCNLAPK